MHSYTCETRGFMHELILYLNFKSNMDQCGRTPKMSADITSIRWSFIICSASNNSFLPYL